MVKKYGGETRRVKWQGRRGAPDDVIFLNGAHFVECKAPGKKPSEHQHREFARMRGCGVEVWVVDSFYAVERLVARISGRCCE